ncbi:MAG: flagellar hook-associated protein FlgL [Chloroflexi bacterium]|nr:flagellar hook-associated protein FlgL [Chloroflexota bacterium]
MRVTHRMIVDTVLSGLNNNLRRLEDLQRQVSSGRRLNRPSDDPPAVERALTYRATLSAGEQYLRNIDAARAWLQASDTALASATEALQRARELAVQGSNDTLGLDQQQAIATEVDQLLAQMVALGNSTLRGQYLFAGHRTQTAPFTLNQGPPTTVTYNGDGGAMLREIDAGVTLQINTPGNSFLPTVVTALINLRDHLRAGDTAAVRNDLPALDAAADTLLAVRADFGAKLNRLDAAEAQRQALQADTTAQLSKIEDTDYGEAITQLTTAELAYKAGLQAGARAMQSNLFDYLR